MSMEFPPAPTISMRVIWHYSVATLTDLNIQNVMAVWKTGILIGCILNYLVLVVRIRLHPISTNFLAPSF